MMRYSRLFMILSITFIVGGCTTHEDTAYLSHQVSQPMVVPAGVQTPMQQPLYAIPKVQAGGHAGNVSLIPPGSHIQ